MQSETHSHNVTAGRSKIYHWLASFFLLKPTYEDLIRALDPQLLYAVEETLHEQERPAIEWLRGFANNLDRTIAERLSHEYHELFIVPMPGTYVPPYESCFRERVSTSEPGYGEMWGKATMSVREFYRRNGFEPRQGSSPPDHLGIELLFMSKMCQREADSILEREEVVCRQARNQELKFLSEHLYGWLPEFTREVVKTGSSDFYTHSAHITDAFVKQDINYLTETVAYE